MTPITINVDDDLAKTFAAASAELRIRTHSRNRSLAGPGSKELPVLRGDTIDSFKTHACPVTVSILKSPSAGVPGAPMSGPLKSMNLPGLSSSP